MNKKRWLFGAVLIGILVQFLCVGGMIAQKEWILRNGTLHRFKVRPVDPFDVMRGRYVQLDFEALGNLVSKTRFERHESVWLRLKKDDAGFSAVETIERESPEQLNDAIRARTGWSYDEHVSVTNRVNGQDKVEYRATGRYHVRVDVPFSRFYMDETLAPEAEWQVAKRGRGAKPAVACVRVLNGRAVLADLEIEGQPIAAWLKANAGKDNR